MPPARKKKRRKVRARRSFAGWPTVPRLELESHQVDLLGLGLVALGVFLAFVVYLGAAGGSVGDGIAHGLRFLIGMLGYAVPAALVVAGVLVVARQAIPTPRPLRAGVLCLTLGLLLALAGHTLGLGPDGAR